MSPRETLELLNLLLAATRAGALTVEAYLADMPSGPVRDALDAAGEDERRSADALAMLVERRGGAPTTAIGDFFEKATAIADPRHRIAFLGRGLAWVVQAIEEALPLIPDRELAGVLAHIADLHRNHATACNRVLR